MLDGILNKMLAPEPDDRYQTASELIVDLERSNLVATLPSFTNPDRAMQDPVVRQRLTALAATQPDVGSGLDRRLVEDQVWYLRYPDAKGQPCMAKLSIAEVRTKLRDGNISSQTEAARVPRGKYKPLASYVEFQHVPGPLATAPRSDSTSPVDYVVAVKDTPFHPAWWITMGLVLGRRLCCSARFCYGYAVNGADDKFWNIILLYESPFDLPLTDPRQPFHAEHMEMALDEARVAVAEDEVPVGAVIVSLKRGVIARAHNQREMLRDPTAHAEMIAITQAAQALESWRLEDCILYATLEPCAMCAGACVLARLPMVVYGATDPKAGACETLYTITSDPRLNHRCQVVRGVCADRCAAILSDFFAGKRRTGKTSLPDRDEHPSRDR